MSTATAYTVTIPPLGTLVRQAYIRLWYGRRGRRRSEAAIGGLEVQPERVWHHIGDRASRGHLGWQLRALCGAFLDIASADLSHAVRPVLEVADLPSGRVCGRCTEGLRRLKAARTGLR